MALGAVGFIVEISEGVSRPKTDQIKGLLHDDVGKDLQQLSVVGVRLKSFDREIRQIWQAGLPWPVYSDNGLTVAKLVKVTPAAKVKTTPKSR